MKSYVALYRGPTIEAAELVGVSLDPDLVAGVAARLLRQKDLESSTDAVLAVKREGERRVLRLIQDEALGPEESV